MAGPFLKIAYAIDKLCEVFGRLAGLLVLLLIGVIIFDITLRHWFVIGSTQLQELEWHLHGAVFLLSMAWAYQKDAHVRIGLVSEKLTTGKKAALEIAGIFIFLLPYTAALLYFASDYVMLSYAYAETSPSPTGLGARYIIKAIMVFGFFLLFLSALSRLIDAFIFLFANERWKSMTSYARPQKGAPGS